MNQIDILVDLKGAKAKRDEAWRSVLATHSGRIVVAEVLKRCHHGEATMDPTHHVLQQLAWELLADAGLMPDSPGSLPVQYVSLLTKTKLEPVPEPEKPRGFFGRLFGRNS